MHLIQQTLNICGILDQSHCGTKDNLSNRNGMEDSIRRPDKK